MAPQYAGACRNRVNALSKASAAGYRPRPFALRADTVDPGVHIGFLDQPAGRNIGKRLRERLRLALGSGWDRVLAVQMAPLAGSTECPAHNA